MLAGFLKVCGGTVLGAVLGVILGMVLVPLPEAEPDDTVCGLTVIPSLIVSLVLGVFGALVAGTTTLIITLAIGAMRADEAAAAAAQKPLPIAEV